jgi:hypothetical protein
MRKLPVGLENRYPSACKVGTCYEAFLFPCINEKGFLRANACDFPELGEILGDQIRNF